ncbi:hypothetical protein [Beutenbergia cavernae]|nr:hypothetical protein [Beutenbergia cavernae]
MRAWIVRLGALLVFNLIVVVAIVLFVPGVRGSWGVLWAAVVLTAATVWVKPLITSFLTDQAGNWAGRPRWLAGKVLTYAIVYVVAFVIWLLTVILSDVNVHGWFLGYVLPPLIVIVGWFVYDMVDDRFEATAGNAYDAAHRRMTGGSSTEASAERPADPSEGPAGPRP